MNPRQPSHHFHAHLLGTFTLRRGKRVACLPVSADARALLAYLLLHREQAQLRAILVGLFFPDLPENRARRALTQALWHVRRILPSIVEADADVIHIPSDAPIWVDVEEFKKIADCRLRSTPLGLRIVRLNLQFLISNLKSLSIAAICLKDFTMTGLCSNASACARCICKRWSNWFS